MQYKSECFISFAAGIVQSAEVILGLHNIRVYSCSVFRRELEVAIFPVCLDSQNTGV